LVQRLYRIGNHCQFSQPEMIRAFDDLVKWVRDGVPERATMVAGDLTDAGRKIHRTVAAWRRWSPVREIQTKNPAR
jgi:hypothetical protein